MTTNEDAEYTQDDEQEFDVTDADEPTDTAPVVAQNTGAQQSDAPKKTRKPRGPNKPMVQLYQIDQLVSLSQEAITKLLSDYVGKTLKDSTAADKLELQIRAAEGDGWHTFTGQLRYATK